MLKKRIIPCLDIKNGRTVKGINFLGLRDAGNPVELARLYAEQGADELVFLDIAATTEKRKARLSLVRRIAEEINIPFTVGGGINTVEDVGELIKAGADKVSINSAAVKHPELIQDIAKEYGSQCVVVAIDTKYIDQKWAVFVQGGTLPTDLSTIEWAKQIEQLGGGEILLTSMDHDGTKNGFALEITDQVAKTVNMPIIASGGAGTMKDFKDVFSQTDASGGLAASVFHFRDISIPALKKYLKREKIPIR